MSDTLITIISIFLAAILMFIFPLMAITERNDDIAQTAVQTACDEFVYDVTSTGKIEAVGNYQQLTQRLAATQNSYELEMTVTHIDENPGKTQTSLKGDGSIGENLSYSSTTTQIMEELAENNGTGIYYLKKGDSITVTAKNTNKTFAQELQLFSKGSTSYRIAGSASGLVVNNGK